MKKILSISTLILSLAIWQGCSSKQDATSEQNTKASKEVVLVENQNIKEAAAKRAALIKEREKRRELALLEKIENSPTYTDASGNLVYYKAEVEPTYTGGLDALSRYLKANLKYPENAEEKGYEGTVFVDFVIAADGKVRGVTPSDAIGQYIDESFKREAVRVVSTMPGWNAGLQNGKAVDASFSIPITFQLANY